MNKYQITHPTFIDCEVDADSMEVLETGQICFYKKVMVPRTTNTTNTSCGVVPVGETEIEELIAVFPAGCAVVKVEEGEWEVEVKWNENTGSVTVPAGNANTVFNEPIL